MNNLPVCLTGKGVSIWDTWAHNGRIGDGDTGDVSADGYNTYMEDIELLKLLKVTCNGQLTTIFLTTSILQ